MNACMSGSCKNLSDVHKVSKKRKAAKARRQKLQETYDNYLTKGSELGMQ